MKRRPCVYPDLKQRADIARQRLDVAISDLLDAVSGLLPNADDERFYRELGRLIRDDNVVAMKRKAK